MAEREAKEHQYLTDDQIKWLESQKIIMDSKPYIFTRPTSAFRLFFYHFIHTRIYHFFTNITLILCAIHLAFYLSTNEMLDLRMLDRISVVLTCIFASEFLIKVISYGAKPYISYGPHKLEFLILSIYLMFCLVFEQEESLIYKSRMIRLISSLRMVALVR